MGLEAVMILLDNSEWSRNGDYTPSRFDCQAETANLLGGSKTGQNPETGVGLITMAGERVEVLQTPTTDLGAFIAALAHVQIRGKTDVCRAIQCATLALKHRQNKNQKQRVICFVGSPVDATEKQLEQLGKSLKKNNVSLDIVSFGEIEDNKAKLQKLIETCNSNDTSHYLEVPVGPRLLSDIVLTSEICFGEGGGAQGGMGAGGGDGFEFGVNPETDPDLAMALQISMQEERRRQEGLNADGAPAEGQTQDAAASTQPAAAAAAAPAASTGATNAASGLAAEIPGFDEMDPELREALMLSMQEQQPAPKSPESKPAPKTEGEPAEKKQKTEPKEEAAKADEASLFQDPDFVAGLLGSLPGVDINDPRIQEAIGQAGDGKEGDKKDGEKKDDKMDDSSKK